MNRTEQNNKIVFLFCVLKILFGVFCYLPNIFLKLLFEHILYNDEE